MMDSIHEPSALVLPPGFKSIKEINELPNSDIMAKKMVDVIGLVKDFQPPTETRGVDYKCTFSLVDESVKYDPFELKVNVFNPKKENLPATLNLKDIVLLRRFKVQMFKGEVSLLSTRGASEIHILPCSKVLASVSSTSVLPAIWASYLVTGTKSRTPTLDETGYVISAHKQVEEAVHRFPSDVEYKQRTKEATTSRDKFSLLKDVKPDKFYNVIGQIIRVYDKGGVEEALTLYLTDYTAHSNFHNYVWGDDPDAGGRDGDEFAYSKSKKKHEPWPGPFGKMTMQLSLWGLQADYARDKVAVNDWVLLSNVQTKIGRSGVMLEGFLRDDRQYPNKVMVEVLQQAEDDEVNDPRWVDAVARKLEYSKKFEAQQKKLLEEAEGLKKRKNEKDDRGNAKKRRKERRALEAKKEVVKSNLNANIRCTDPNQPIVSLKEPLRPLPILQKDKSEELTAPFTTCKYKANVRVLDYFPDHIEDFAVGRRRSDLNILTDYSGGEDTDVEEDRRTWKQGKGTARKDWEWRFSLQVEDIDAKDSAERLWLMVDNPSAQYLLGLEENAANLRQDPELLEKLKAQLCILWGDLEERKSATLKKTEKEQIPHSSIPSSLLSPPRKVGDQPDLDSDDDKENTTFSTQIPKKQNLDIVMKDQHDESRNDIRLAPKNKAFTCCIRQYGVKVKEDDATKANAGEGWRWERRFGLFNTMIA